MSDSPSVSLGVVDCSIYTRRVDLQYDYHRNRIHMLAYTLVEFNCLETLSKTFFIPSRRKCFFQKTISTKLQLVDMPLRWRKEQCVKRFSLWESIVTSSMWSQTQEIILIWSVKRRLRCCGLVLLFCYNNESTELLRIYHLISWP